MAQWNRRVSVTADGNHLQVDDVTPNPEPPAPPGKNRNRDTATDIYVYEEDRPATVRYVSDGAGTLGIEVKGGGNLPSGYSQSNQNDNLTITDNGAENVNVSYYVTGSWNGNDIKTQDPMIHNLGG